MQLGGMWRCGYVVINGISRLINRIIGLLLAFTNPKRQGRISGCLQALSWLGPLNLRRGAGQVWDSCDLVIPIQVHGTMSLKALKH